MERETWLVWRSRPLVRVTVWVSFHLFFPPEESPSPGGSVSAVWPRGHALGCGHWVPKHPGKRCSCIDSSGGTKAGCLMRAAIALSLLMSQPRDGQLLFINCGLFIRLVFLCGGRTGYSAGMFFGLSGGFNSAWLL